MNSRRNGSLTQPPEPSRVATAEASAPTTTRKPPMASPIFISYSSTDRQTADKIRDLLVANGHECFMAPYGIGPGDIWSDKLAEAIDRASMVVLIFSERCNRSDHVKSELAMA